MGIQAAGTDIQIHAETFKPSDNHLNFCVHHDYDVGTHGFKHGVKHTQPRLEHRRIFSMINEELMSPILMWLWNLFDLLYDILLDNEICSLLVSLYLLSARVREILDTT